MASWVTSGRCARLLVLPALAALVTVVAACTSLDRPRVQPDVVPMASPQRSIDAALTPTVDALRDALAATGERIDLTTSPYRPAEPASLVLVPRAVLRTELADADDGFVVVYQAADGASADQMATELASYLGSGFGQTNYPADTRFSVAVVGDSVVFTSFSAGRSSDAERAERAFEAVASVGRAIEVSK